MKKETALLIGIVSQKRDMPVAMDSLAELKELAQTAGVEVLHEEMLQVRQISPASYIRLGNIDKIRELIETYKITLILIDIELSPAQNRNLEAAWNTRVIDRTGLILDIFAIHAKSKEGKIQVELAQYEYLYPRLVGAWTHLSKQRGGGVGLRGPGETQLEVDRRRVRERIVRLKDQLKQVESSREIHRRTRMAVPLPTVTLVGYTNAGKSTLFNRLAAGSQLSADQLFATLDPKTKKIKLKSGREILLTDTVGFIRHLPHQLVEAFKSTFEEARHSDLLLHVVDASRTDNRDHIKVVNDVLTEIGLDEIPQLLVLNKMDQHGDADRVYLERNEVSVSALVGTGMDILLKRMDDELSETLNHVDFFIPYDAQASLSLFYEHGRVLSKKNTDEGVCGEAYLTDKWMQKLKAYVTLKEST